MLNIHPIPALETNYFWLLQPSAESPGVYIMDPGDAKPVIERLEAGQFQLMGIIITHHHWDHTNGINDLLAHYSVPVYGPDSPRIPQITHKLADGDFLELPGLRFEVLGVPGHTLDHIAYLCHQGDCNDQPNLLFCGDSLFAGGCGRMFEGQPAQMLASLEKLSALPDSTLVYCSHEYTQPNLEFALEVEPANERLRARLREVDDLRARKEMTLPSTIGLEKGTNPYLRCHLPDVKAMAELHTGQQLNANAEVFAAIRLWKDQT